MGQTVKTRSTVSVQNYVRVLVATAVVASSIAFVFSVFAMRGGLKDLRSVQVTVPVSTTTTITGQLEAIMVDNFEENTSVTEYRLYADGTVYDLITDDQDVLRYIGSEVVVSGSVQDDTILAESVLPSAMKTQVSRLAPTVGEKSFLAIFLKKDSEPDIDTVAFTESMFSLTNDFVSTSSYGIANVAIGGSMQFSIPDDAFNCPSPYTIMDIGISQLDLHYDLSLYEGIVVYHPDLGTNPVSGVRCSNYSGMANLTTAVIATDDVPEGYVYMYKIWMNRMYESDPTDPATFIHEMGHGFGLMHSSLAICGTYPDRTAFATSCLMDEYGDRYNIMGKPWLHGDFSVRDKSLVLGWVDYDTDITATVAGRYTLAPYQADPSASAQPHGLEIPIRWGNSLFLVDNLYDIPDRGLIDPTLPQNNGMGVNSYYVEFRNAIDTELFEDTYYALECGDAPRDLYMEDFTEGLMIRLGRNNNMRDETDTYSWLTYDWLLSAHPNVEICGDGRNADRIMCQLLGSTCYNGIDYAASFSPLGVGERYIDSYNKTIITFEEVTADGAVVQVEDYLLCPDLNYDGIADAQDVDTLGSDYHDTTSGVYHARSDMNMDGELSLADVGLYASSYFLHDYRCDIQAVDNYTLCQDVCSGEYVYAQSVDVCDCSEPSPEKYPKKVSPSE